LEMHMYFLESLKPFPNTTRRHYYWLDNLKTEPWRRSLGNTFPFLQD
jgi:hypothetical protein